MEHRAVQYTKTRCGSTRIEIADAFRAGKYDASQVRHRPIIVKLRTIWDKRLVLSNARKLSEITEYCHIGFAPDEPLESGDPSSERHETTT